MAADDKPINAEGGWKRLTHVLGTLTAVRLRHVHNYNRALRSLRKGR